MLTPDLFTACGTFVTTVVAAIGVILAYIDKAKKNKDADKAFFHSVETVFHAVEAEFPNNTILSKVDRAITKLKPYLTSANIEVTEAQLVMARDLLLAAHGKKNTEGLPVGTLTSVLQEPAATTPVSVALTAEQEAAIVDKAVTAFREILTRKDPK